MAFGFKNDIKNEAISTNFIEKKTSIFKHMGISKINRDDVELQKLGVDLIYKDKRNGQIKYCDMKTIYSYDFPTFCFELLGVESTNQVGWFLNDNLLTNSYLLTYHGIYNGTGSYSKDKNLATIDNIEKTQCLWIDKQNLKNEVLNLLPEGTDLLSVAKQIQALGSSKREKETDAVWGNYKYAFDNEGQLIEIDDKIKRRMTKEKGKEFIYFTYSPSLKEHPINMVLSRDFLTDLALIFDDEQKHEVFITKEQADEIKKIIGECPLKAGVLKFIKKDAN